jgi:hypothetical protein
MLDEVKIKCRECNKLVGGKWARSGGWRAG